MLVLVSSTSFKVNMHICGGHVASVALVQQATACPMEIMPPCHGVHQEKKSNGCCEDKSVAFDGKEFSSNVEHISLEQQSASWIVEIHYIVSIAPSTTLKDQSTLTLYKPPLLSQDISVLVHSFQI